MVCHNREIGSSSKREKGSHARRQNDNIATVLRCTVPDVVVYRTVVRATDTFFLTSREHYSHLTSLDGERRYRRATGLDGGEGTRAGNGVTEYPNGQSHCMTRDGWHLYGRMEADGV